MENCQAASYCNSYQKEGICNKYCVGFNQLNVIYKLSHMPKKYQYPSRLVPDQVDHKAFVHLRDTWLGDDLVKKIKKGEGLFLISTNKGNGKTTWATKIMNEYFRKVALKNNMRCRGLFINVPEFFKRVRDSFDNPDPELRELIDDIKTADLVIWDDIGTESPTKFVVEQLYIYINYREANLKSQFFTSNLPIDVLNQDEYLGERIVSRIKGQCELIEFFGGDKR